MEPANLTELFTQELGRSILRVSAHAALDLFQLVSTGKIAEEEGRERLAYYQKILPKLREIGAALNCNIPDTLEQRLVGSETNAARSLPPVPESQATPQPSPPPPPDTPNGSAEPAYRSLLNWTDCYPVTKKLTAAAYLRIGAANNPLLLKNSMLRGRGRVYKDTPEVREAIADLLKKGEWLRDNEQPQQVLQKNVNLNIASLITTTQGLRQSAAGVPHPDKNTSSLGSAAQERVPYRVMKVAERTGIPEEFIARHEKELDVKATGQGGDKTYAVERLPYVTELWQGNAGKAYRKENNE